MASIMAITASYKPHLPVRSLEGMAHSTAKARSTPETDMIKQEKLNRLWAIVRLDPQADQIFLICQNLFEHNGPNSESRKAIAADLQITSDEASLYEEWAIRMLVINGKPVFREIAQMTPAQIRAKLRRLGI